MPRSTYRMKIKLQYLDVEGWSSTDVAETINYASRSDPPRAA